MAKLLIITQKVDQQDHALGFVCGWIREFSVNFDSVVVVCLQGGQYSLPSNVRVISLGKERGGSRLSYLTRFYSIIWKERNNYDGVFIHMNPIYGILGSVFWRLNKKKVILWYTHITDTFKLRMAELLVDKIVTADKSSFPLLSEKVVAMGHGIDTRFFKKDENIQSKPNSILFLGRISPVKRHSLLIESLKILSGRGLSFHCNIMGDYALSHRSYFLELKKIIRGYDLNDKIEITDPVYYQMLPEVFNGYSLLASFTKAGSFDKAVLSAMACEVPVVTTNEAFKGSGGVRIVSDSPEDIADSFEDVFGMSETERVSLGREERVFVEKNHNLTGLVKKIRGLYD